MFAYFFAIICIAILGTTTTSQHFDANRKNFFVNAEQIRPDPFLDQFKHRCIPDPYLSTPLLHRHAIWKIPPRIFQVTIFIIKKYDI